MLAQAYHDLKHAQRKQEAKAMFRIETDLYKIDEDDGVLTVTDKETHWTCVLTHGLTRAFFDALQGYIHDSLDGTYPLCDAVKCACQDVFEGTLEE